MTAEQAFHLALVYRQAGRLVEAENLLRQIVQVVPGHGDAWHQLGLVTLTLERPAEAVESIARAIAVNANQAKYHADQAVAFWRLRRGEESIAASERAIRLAPNVAHFHRNLGDVLFGTAKADEAIVSYRRSLAIAPNEAATHNNLGNVYLQQKRLAEAAVCYQQAVQLEPRLLVAQSNLGDILTKLDRAEEGLVCAQRVVALDPNFPDGHLNMGVCYWHLRRFAEAEACYRRALALRSDFANAHLNLGVLYLILGRFEEGWREYEWHWRSPTHASRRRELSVPPWDGSRAAGQTLLAYADQGAGDTVHFLRYLPLLLEHSGAARIVVECQPALLPLVTQLRSEHIDFSPRATVGQPAPPHDQHIPLFSLPLALRRFEPLPMDGPYLHADDRRRAVWRDRLESRARLRVGLAWAGNPAHLDDRRRSMPPELLLPLLHVPDVCFVSLQVDPRGPLPPAMASAGLVDLTAEIHDFADTAALLAELDLVITVDTSTAHVAGALGVPVWVMLPYIPDWRWGFDREDTPWYPTMRFFRQTKAGDWAGVVDRVAAALRTYRQ